MSLPHTKLSTLILENHYCILKNILKIRWHLVIKNLFKLNKSYIFLCLEYCHYSVSVFWKIQIPHETCLPKAYHLVFISGLWQGARQEKRRWGNGSNNNYVCVRQGECVCCMCVWLVCIRWKKKWERPVQGCVQLALYLSYNVSLSHCDINL